MHSFFAGVLLVFISAFGFGLMPILALYAYRSGINVPTLLFLRFGIAAICLGAYIVVRRIRWTVPRREMLSLFFFRKCPVHAAVHFLLFSSSVYSGITGSLDPLPLSGFGGTAGRAVGEGNLRLAEPGAGIVVADWHRDCAGSSL